MKRNPQPAAHPWAAQPVQLMKWLGWIAGVALFLLGIIMNFLNRSGTPLSWNGLSPLLLLFSCILLRWVWPIHLVNKTHWGLSWQGIVVVLLGIGFLILYALTALTLAAWAVTVFLFVLILELDELFSVSLQERSPVYRWLLHILMAFACALFLALMTEIESHFADEEFFVALQALFLAAYWLAFRGIWVFLHSRYPGPAFLPVNAFPSRQAGPGFGAGRAFVARLSTRWLILSCLGLTAGFMIWAVRLYQTSFYPPAAPSYPGVSAESPFLCGQVPADPQTYTGQDVFQRLLSLVAANPQKSTPEYGMLALATGNVSWADLFHAGLLSESRQALFTGASGSVKSVQFEAAFRAYYYSKIRTAFPDLFSASEDVSIRQWFAAINRRALTVEPVDWLYALAFSKWPQGPYENQENGAGLLAVLESTGLSDPALSSRNRSYLAANPRGWIARFRVTDDALVYQPEWLDNAYFQSLFTGARPGKNLRLSFEWLLLQALPDGAPLRYNHLGSVSLQGIESLGAGLTGDDHYLWIAGRAADYLQSHGGFASAQPGLESAVSLPGASPTEGSCLLYGDSGLPNQAGPLAPDKIVLRDGWRADSTYLLLDLRFTGWHRYKATNAVTLVYKNGPLVVENAVSKPFSWLPVGRSLFRDKRIPRENLNGLVVARTGMSAVLYNLTSIGGLWAQDPPYYARVVSFDPAASTSVTELSGWRGWSQTRTIALHPDGLTISDNARGPRIQSAAIIWHFPAGASVSGSRVIIRSGDHPADAIISVPAGESILSFPEETGLRVEIHGRGQVQASLLIRTDGQAGGY